MTKLFFFELMYGMVGPDIRPSVCQKGEDQREKNCRYQLLIKPGFACALENEVEWQNYYYRRK